MIVGQMGVAIVTGAAKGLGRAYALALAREGWSVVAADVLDVDAVVDELGAAGGSALGAQVDVSDERSTEALAAATLERFGRIDALVNNAAIFTSIEKKPFDELTVEEWDRMFAVNVRGTWLCCKAVTPTMKEARAGRIVNVSSMTVPGGIPLFLALPWAGGREMLALDAAGWAALLYLSLLCSIGGFAVWAWLVRRLPVSTAGLTTFLNPPLTLASKALLVAFFPATFTFAVLPLEILGGAVVLAGLAVAILR